MNTNMNSMMKFYTMMLAFLQSDFKADTHVVEGILALAMKVKPSWEVNLLNVRFLELCCKKSSTVKDDESLFRTLQDFAKAAFRDLSIIKKVEAMELFHKIAGHVVPTYRAGEDIFIWARDIKSRPDGSAVVTLHVTDLERFRKLIEQHDFVDHSTEYGNLEGGVQIGS